jgi:hypothetical protein
MDKSAIALRDTILKAAKVNPKWRTLKILELKKQRKLK